MSTGLFAKNTKMKESVRLSNSLWMFLCGEDGARTHAHKHCFIVSLHYFIPVGANKCFSGTRRTDLTALFFIISLTSTLLDKKPYLFINVPLKMDKLHLVTVDGERGGSSGANNGLLPETFVAAAPQVNEASAGRS